MLNLKRYLSQPYPCQYLPKQTARSQILSPLEPLSPSTYEALLNQNFRRAGLFVYRPHCTHCQSCIPVRINLKKFAIRGSQKRILKRHQHLLTEQTAPYFSEAHYQLYRRYQRIRHHDTSTHQETHHQYHQILLKSHFKTLLTAFYQTDDNQPTAKHLKMVSLTDCLENSLSLVYAFFECEPKASYGIFNILWHIDLAQQHHLSYIHLGYWIKK